MDNRELELAKFTIEQLKVYNQSILETIDILIKKDKELNASNLFFVGDAFTLASNFVFKLVMRTNDRDEEYCKYSDFFDEFFKSAKKDIISGEFLTKIDNLWQPVILWIEALKSYAKGKGLKPNAVSMHLDRYIKEKPTEPLINIPTWDGVDRIKELGKFITLIGHPYEIFEDAFKEWLANIFRRLYQDNAQNRCIILKGNQGIGKDHLIKNILGAFGPYYSKFTNNRDERAIWDQVTSSLVLHIEEFDQTGSLGVPFLKDIITRDMVTYRSSYGKSNRTRKCHGSFISTVNIDAVLRDETGNRRFAVFEIGRIDWAYPKDIGQHILAQAYALYTSNYKAKKETWLSVMHGNTQYEQVDLVPELLEYWDDALGKMALPKNSTGFPFSKVTGVLVELCKISGWKQKTLLSVLKTNNRSRHSEFGTIYFSKELTDRSRLKVVASSDGDTYKHKVNVDDRSKTNIDQPIDHV